MGALSPTHWLIIIGVVVLLFGASKMPDFARSVGQSMRILKAETSELRDPRTNSEPDTRDAAIPPRPAPLEPRLANEGGQASQSSADRSSGAMETPRPS